MAAQSTPLLRTSQRRKQPTILHRDSGHPSLNHNNDLPPATHGRKRAHETISSNDRHPVLKKQRLDPRALLHPNAALRDPIAPKPLKTASSDCSSVNSTGNSRITSVVQPPANGTITTNGDFQHQLPAEIAQSQTSNTSKDADKRTLRSQDGGSRSRSELALYFPNYDELIGNEPKETGKSTTPRPLRSTHQC